MKKERFTEKFVNNFGWAFVITGACIAMNICCEYAMNATIDLLLKD